LASPSIALLAINLYSVVPTPVEQRLLLSGCLELIPSIEHSTMFEKILEVSIGTATT